MRPLLALFLLLTLTTPASAECACVLWVEAPQGSDQWSIASVPQSRFTTREACQQQADDLNAFELTVAKMQRADGDAHDVFSCYPCWVDPRPESAVLREGTDPRGPKRK